MKEVEPVKKIDVESALESKRINLEELNLTGHDLRSIGNDFRRHGHLDHWKKEKKCYH
jgi:hypothetical protein